MSSPNRDAIHIGVVLRIQIVDKNDPLRPFHLTVSIGDPGSSNTTSQFVARPITIVCIS